MEGWEVRHAIREIIANALDEQVLTGTKDVALTADSDGAWHIRDWGRGLRYESLTQDENQEKLNQPNRVIGKFGVGLKDALATLNRRGVRVCFRSQHCDISLLEIPKHGFSNVVTLHAAVGPPTDPDFAGTDACLSGVSASEIEAAKDFFLKFSSEELLDETSHGQILVADPPVARGFT